MPTERKKDLIQEGLRKMISEKKIERKMLKKIRIILVLNDMEAMVMFPLVDGRADMREAFYGSDPKFLEWCNDYFDDCHKKAESFTEKEIRYFDKDHIV